MADRPKGRTMYMHTLDGKPANFDVSTVDGEPYIYFAGGRNRAQLVPSLQQIRREQRLAQEAAARAGGNQFEWSDPKHYGYALVEVPHVR